VTEGVETAIQNEKLLNMGCDVVQGYLFGKPVPPAEFYD
jgi:EAL domain-containing protein (putative c-di-GMP-specific phosphodiesterase class I)